MTQEFRKQMPRAQAQAEMNGWTELTATIPLPALIGRIEGSDGDVVVYEDIFASGRCRLLLADLIAQADRNPALIPHLVRLIDGICQDLCIAVARTGGVRPLCDCVPGLYADRIRRGRRIDTWYLASDPVVYMGKQCMLTVRDLADYELTVGDRTYHVDIERIISGLREELSAGSLWLTAITQGDPTEPNIAWPRCWLDLQHAGRNTLAGEIANLIWYLLALGGWQVPRAQPNVYARTTRLALPPIAVPTTTHVHVDDKERHIHAEYTWNTGPGRRAAISRVIQWVLGALGAAARLRPGAELMQLRGFLALRILGVIPPALLTPAEILLTVIKLAESQHPATSLRRFAHTPPPPAPL
ncbi:MAG: hypothetical protein LBJ87_08185 [bacterium]|nr:hypothetical protein [bacterium]